MQIGDSIYTPRFCTVRIATIFENEAEARAMRVLVVEPERRPELREIDDSLKAMQKIVGG